MSVPPFRRSPLRGRSWCLPALLLTACATNDTTSVLRELPPAPLVVVIDSDVPAGSGDAELQFRATAADMQTMLAQELRALDASSRVVTRSELGTDRADVAIKLVPRGQIRFEHTATASYLGAGGLWLVSWIGGLLVPDSTYTVRMDASCRYAQAGDENQYFEREVAGGEVDLSFFERNDLISLPALQSLVLPPFWTTDQSDKTSAALTRSSMQLVARRIATELKQDFERLAEVEFLCSVRVQTPRNGQSVSSRTMPITLTAVSQASDPVSRVTASVNGGAPQTLELVLGRDGASKVEARGELQGLDPAAENWVRIDVTAGKIYTRTLRLKGNS
jgi:hypothetical protein